MCESKVNIKFGTDGWRAIISEDFTFENVRRVAQAIADYYLTKLNKEKVALAVGYDMRFLSSNYADTVAEVLAQNGIDVILSDKAVPTPTLSFAVKNRKLDAGVMITASHNPQEYNGIKIKTAEGGAAGTDITKEVEKFIFTPLAAKEVAKGKIEKLDLIKEYVKFLRGYVDLSKFKKAKFKVLVDPMYGSGCGYLEQVLKGSGIKLEFTRNERNPSFGELRPEPIPENLQATIKKIKSQKYDLCIVLDGDADRVAAISGDGEFVSPQRILGLLLLHLIQDRKMDGGVVKTVVGTNLIDNIAQDLKLELYETPVGFKYISELMVSKNIVVGGEEAGGIGFKNYVPERDGSLAGLLILEMMVNRKKNFLQLLKDMETKYGRYYYLRDYLKLSKQISLDFAKNEKKVLDMEVESVNDSDGIKLICKDKSWLMLRASGTEPIVRVYSESKNLAKSKKMLEFGKRLILNNVI